MAKMDMIASQCSYCLQAEQGGHVDGPRGAGRPVVAVLLAHLVIPTPLTPVNTPGLHGVHCRNAEMMHLVLHATVSLVRGADPQLQRLRI